MGEGEQVEVVVGEEAAAVVRNLHLWIENAMRRWQRLQEPVVAAVAAGVVVDADADVAVDMETFK